MHSSDLGVNVVTYSASAAAKEFTENLTGASLRNKSGPEFFGFAKISVQHQLQAAALRDSDIFGNTDYAATDADCVQASRTGSRSGREEQQKMSFQLLQAGEILSKDGWAEHEVARLYFVCEDEELECRDGYVCEQLLLDVSAVVRCTVSNFACAIFLAGPRF